MRFYFEYIKKTNERREEDFGDILQFVDEITIPQKHCFYGYYDKSPISVNHDLALFHSVPFSSNTRNNADIMLYNLNNKQINLVESTSAWNWQQGSMLQWVNNHNNEIIFNVYNKSNSAYYSKQVNVITKHSTEYPLPIYFQSNDGLRFLSLNFKRLNRFAKGYGYCCHNESESLDDTNDGIWEYDIQNSTSKLLLSFDELKEFKHIQEFYDYPNYINHVCYTPDQCSILFIHRWCVNVQTFSSRLVLMDLKTRTLRLLLDNRHVSHYTWSSSNVLLIYATNNFGEKGYFEVQLDSVNQSRVIDFLPSEDGHPSYFREKYLITDTYPHLNRKQYLCVYDVDQQNIVYKKSFHSPCRYFDDYRCDLHPKVCNNNYISVDTTESGRRTVKLFKINS